MKLLCTFAPALLGLALAAAPAAAQTKLPTHRVTRPAARLAPASAAAAPTTNPHRGSGTNDNGKGENSYAAPGQPINVQDNGKNTPPYDGPAAGHGTPSKGLTMPRKQ